MCIQGVSKSQVSELGQEPGRDGRNRPLDTGFYSYVWVDALSQRCREGDRLGNVATVAIGVNADGQREILGVNADGQREILGVDVFTTEDGAAWTSFLRGLVARGLSGVTLVISDSQAGLGAAIAAVLPEHSNVRDQPGATGRGPRPLSLRPS